MGLPEHSSDRVAQLAEHCAIGVVHTDQSTDTPGQVMLIAGLHRSIVRARRLGPAASALTVTSGSRGPSTLDQRLISPHDLALSTVYEV